MPASGCTRSLCSTLQNKCEQEEKGEEVLKDKWREGSPTWNGLRCQNAAAEVLEVSGVRLYIVL